MAAVSAAQVKAAFAKYGFSFDKEPEAQEACVKLAKELGVSAERLASDYEVMNAVG
jgi:hypothetical protein